MGDLTYPLSNRTQDRDGGTRQRRQDHHPVPAVDEWSGAHITHHRQQRGGGGVEEPALHHVGFRWARVPQISMEHLLH